MAAMDTAFVVAHRAGNDLRALERARASGCLLVEADVHLFRGRLEVRHRKTLGPLPILWDKWELAPPAKDPLVLGQLLEALGSDLEPMLDLKGLDPRLSRRVRHALAEGPRAARVTVCARNWAHLKAFERDPGVRVIHSVGSRRQLRALDVLLGRSPLEGISIRRSLLDAETVALLRRRVGTIMAWPVDDPADAVELAGWGVHALISRNFERVAESLAGRPQSEEVVA